MLDVLHFSSQFPDLVLQIPDGGSYIPHLTEQVIVAVHGDGLVLLQDRPEELGVLFDLHSHGVAGVLQGAVVAPHCRVLLSKILQCLFLDGGEVTHLSI